MNTTALIEGQEMNGILCDGQADVGLMIVELTTHWDWEFIHGGTRLLRRLNPKAPNTQYVNWDNE